MTLETSNGLFDRQQLKVLITGDSLAYNRYDFDPEFRTNAYDCYPGMLSWSFLVRDALWQNDEWYRFGDELDISGCVSGLTCSNGNMADEATQLKYSCANHGRVTTLIVKGGAESCYISYKHGNGHNKAVLYLQKRPDEYACSFDILVDGIPAALNVSLKGDMSRFRGWEIIAVELQLPGDNCAHTISFINVKSCSGLDEKRITVCGVGTRCISIALTGCGGKTARFFLENINERILDFQPDFMIFIVGANDRVYETLGVFKANLNELLSKIRDSNPDIGMLLISPPSSRHKDYSDDSMKPRFISDETSAKYNDILREASECFNFSYLDLFDLLRPGDYENWRFDNVHLNKAGNEILAKKVLSILIPGGRYNRELVSTTYWKAD